MFKDIDIMDPDFIIEGSKLETAVEVYSIMRDEKAAKFGYVLARRTKKFEYDIIKIGESAPAKTSIKKGIYGERIARQLDNMDGWNDPSPRSSHGCDLQKAINDAIRNGQLPAGFNKDDVLVGVWNLTSRMPTMLASDKEESRWLEGELAKQYKKSHKGKLPILNIADPEQNKAFSNSHIPLEVWNTLFPQN